MHVSTPQNPQSSNDSRRQLVALSTLLQLERSARHARDRSQLGFVIVNETHRLLRYRQAVLWSESGGVRAISGVSDTDRDAPLPRWLDAALRPLASTNSARLLAADDLPGDRADYLPEHCAWVPLAGEATGPRVGLLLARDQPWQDSELELAGRLAEAYGHAWAALDRRGWLRRSLHGIGRARLLLTLVIVLVAAGFIPVSLTSLAPAEVTPRDPLPVTMPLSGVVAEILVRPNQQVQANQPLLRLDDTEARNNATIARRTLAVAEADYNRAAQGAFSDINSKSELALLEARRNKAQAELSYYEDLLRRVEVRAAGAGIAVFSNVNDWIGRPVSVGERVMMLADPAMVELTLRLSVADAIQLQPGTRVTLFLDTEPLRPLEAVLTSADYEAKTTEDGQLAFRLTASLKSAGDPPRIGARGTAKLYGERVSLAYYLFRRPLGAMRQWLGL